MGLRPDLLADVGGCQPTTPESPLPNYSELLVCVLHGVLVILDLERLLSTVIVESRARWIG
jgi:hypothetical protein